jgi:hypothetical protein
MVKAQCFKDKIKVDVVNPQYELNGIGRPIVRGTCAKCGGKVYKLLPADEVPAALKAKADKYKQDKAKKGGFRKSRSSKSRKSRKSKSSSKKSPSKSQLRKRSRRSRKSTHK